MSRPRLLVIQHEDDAPPAWFGEWIEEAGVEVDLLLAHLGDAVPAGLGSHDALMVLGGEMGAYDDAAHPWLGPTKRLIASTVAAGRCFLGICLGHQLGAAALGGQVIANPHGQANGLARVTLTEDGRRDDVLKAVPDGARSIQWNNDIVARLPAGAVTLATAPDGTIQAARFAPSAWGVQFHPEASPAVFETWVAAADPRDHEARARLGATLGAIEAAEADLRRDWQPLARSFADAVTARRPVP